MAVSKPNIVWKGTSADSFTPGRSAKISRITEHHVVGDASAAIARAAKSGEGFSSNYTIAMDGTIYQLVKDSDTAWADNYWPSNQITISIEHAGGKDGYPYTDAMYAASAHLHAWLIQQYGINEFIRHRDVVAGMPGKGTACPGGLDVERIVRDAKKILSGQVKGASTMSVNALEEQEIKALTRFGFGRDPRSEDEWRHWVGFTLMEYLNQQLALDDKEWHERNDHAVKFAEVEADLKRTERERNDLQKGLDSQKVAQIKDIVNK